MNKLLASLSIAFIGFIIWVVMRADAGQPTIFQLFALSLPFGDKIGHFCLFGSLALLLNHVMQLRTLSLGRLKLYLGGICVFSFAFLEEISQLLFPQRSFDWLDLLADICAIIAAQLVTYYWAKRQQKI